jgi:hypothetical protein
MPHVGVINGAQVVLPVLPDGGMEILVGVDEDCLEWFVLSLFWVLYWECGLTFV